MDTYQQVDLGFNGEHWVEIHTMEDEQPVFLIFHDGNSLPITIHIDNLIQATQFCKELMVAVRTKVNQGDWI